MYQHPPFSGGNWKVSDGGLLVPKKLKSYPTAFDFFAGCGGFSLGFIRAGYEVVGALEYDASAAHTYMTNLGSYPINIHYTSKKYQDILEKYFDKAFKKILKTGNKKTLKGGVRTESNVIDLCDNVSGNGWIQSQRIHNGRNYPPVKNFFFGDICEVSGEWILERLGMEKGELDVVMGGPPCQGFTKVNRNRSPLDVRNNLVFEFARKIVEMEPTTFVMENVPDMVDMVTPEGIPVIDALTMILDEGGFGTFDALRASLLASSGCGIGKKSTTFKNKKVQKKQKVTPPLIPPRRGNLELEFATA